MRGQKKLALSLAIWVALIEGAGWIADGLFGHRTALIEAIDAARPRTEPIAARDPAWPAGALRVRVPDRYGHARTRIGSAARRSATRGRTPSKSCSSRASSMASGDPA